MVHRFGKQGLAAAVATALMAWGAQANAGAFVGGSVGDATVESDLPVDSGFDFDESDTAYKIFGGYMFMDFLGVELGYVDFGEPNDDFSFDTGAGAVDVSVQGEVTGITLALVGQVPLGPVDLFAKLGFISYDAEVDLRATDGIDTFTEKLDEDGEELAYGVGAKLNLGPVGVRAEYELYDVEGVDELYMWSLGAQINF